jgi:cytochrome c
MIPKVLTSLLGIGFVALLPGCQQGQDNSADKTETAVIDAEAPAPAAPAKEEPVAADTFENVETEVAAVAAEPTQETAKPKPTPAASTPAPETQIVGVIRPASFAKCSICHSDEQGVRSGFGPNLFGIAGTTSGAVDGFVFSPAMKNAGIVWTRDNLDDFIEAPQKVIPGNRMAFAGIKNPSERKEIVDYLMQLK